MNWGLVGLLAFDLVAAIFGEMSLISRIVYVLVALTGVNLLVAGLTRRSATTTITTGTTTHTTR